MSSVASRNEGDSTVGSCEVVAMSSPTSRQGTLESLIPRADVYFYREESSCIRVGVSSKYASQSCARHNRLWARVCLTRQQSVSEGDLELKEVETARFCMQIGKERSTADKRDVAMRLTRF
jgi:hypothetical protein